MRLLRLSNDGVYSLTKDFIDTNSVPPYAILSHTWYSDIEEVTFDDLTSGTGSEKRGFEKIRFCGEQAQRDGLEYFWIDTCCINKPNFTELSQAINSMFRWYQQSAKCYVYLSDVPANSSEQVPLDIVLKSPYSFKIRNSRWFSRGWTLQELIAPSSVEFFSSEGTYLGDKQSLQDEIYSITGVPIQALQGSPLAQFSVTERLSWAVGRNTTIEEDQVYCVLGIFQVHLPLIYGEGKENALRRLQKEISTVDDHENTIACLESLDAADQTRFLAQTLHHSKGTWAWISSNPQYRTWLQNRNGAILWITAKAGCGKTTAAAHISQLVTNTPLLDDPASLQADVQPVLLYFFFQKSNDKEERSGLAALRAFASQLVRQSQQVLLVLLKRYIRLSAKGSFEWTWRSLSGVLREMLERVPTDVHIYIILDGVDECEDGSRALIIDWMKALVEEPQAPFPKTSRPSVKVLATSRPDGDILDLLHHVPTLAIQEADTADDMRALIHSRVDDLKHLRKLKTDIATSITQTLEEKAQGMFLWVVLVMQELERRDQGLSDSVINSKLSCIPLTLVDTYEAIIHAAPPTRREDMWRIIRWLLFAYRSLTLEELEEGLCLETGGTGWHGFASDVEFLCGPLIRFDGKRSEINFVHQTAGGFLEAYVQDATSEDVAGLDMTVPGANEHLATLCVQYLLDLDDAVDLPSLLSVTQSPATYASTINNFLSHFAFLRYAIENWHRHAHSLPTPSKTLTSLLYTLFSSPRRRENIMLLTVFLGKHGSTHVPLVHSALHLAAYFNLPTLIPIYLSHDGIPVDIVADTNDTPLLWAAETGATECVRRLLDAGADPNRCEDDGWSALHWAARNGHGEVVTLLLERGARVGQRDGRGHTALDWARDREHREVVEMIERWMRAGGRRRSGEWKTAQRRTSKGAWQLSDVRP